MKTLYAVFVISLIGFYLLDNNGRSDRPPTIVSAVTAPAPAISQPIQPALREVPTSNATSPSKFGRADAGRQISGSGAVTRILSDDNNGSRHQRFIIRLSSGQTLLVAHNIDLAPRITGIAVNDRIEFDGEYEWNSQGGVVHWTHNDPNGRHTNGWLKSKGRTYQ